MTTTARAAALAFDRALLPDGRVERGAFGGGVDVTVSFTGGFAGAFVVFAAAFAAGFGIDFAGGAFAGGVLAAVFDAALAGFAATFLGAAGFFSVARFLSLPADFFVAPDFVLGFFAVAIIASSARSRRRRLRA
jgi:hypothetical protein